MTFKKEDMVKFKEFLDSHGMFDYFYKAFLDTELNKSFKFGPSFTRMYGVINTFDWTKADHKYKPPLSFSRLDDAWCDISGEDSATQEDRKVFILELKRLDKTRALLRAIRMSYD